MTFEKNPDWPDRNALPHARELLALLEQGAQCRVTGHTLSPDEHCVWVTNPYGNECGLLQDLTLQRVENFLSDMAKEKEYGLAP